MLPNQNPEFETLVPDLKDQLVFSTVHKSQSILIQDAESGRFYSIGKREYQLLALLDGKRTHQQIYDLYLSKYNEQQTSQSEPLSWEQAKSVFEFLGRENLLDSLNGNKLPASQTPDAVKPRIQNVNPIGFKLRLFDADGLSNKLKGFGQVLFSPVFVVLWLLVVGWATIAAYSEFERLVQQTKVVIQPENWIWLSLAWVVLKSLHELAHAIACKHYGGRVGDMAINFLLLLPLPNVDVTSSWQIASRWKRIGIAAAGMLVEVFFAAILLIAWSFDLHPSFNNIAVQVILMASVTTILFNANPLMKFDGYFIFSDLIRKPNLATNGARYLNSRIKQTLFGITSIDSNRFFDWGTKCYGWLAAIWRITISVGLLIAAATLFHGAGIVLAALAIVAWYVKPAAKFLFSCFGKNATQIVSWRRTVTMFGTLAGVAFVSTWLPWPFAPEAESVVDFAEQEILRAKSKGFLKELHAHDGQWVNKGDLIGVIENQNLKLKLHSLQVEKQLAEVNCKKLRRENRYSEYQSELQSIRAIQEQISVLEKQVQELKVYAPISGELISPDLANRIGAFVNTGDVIGKVVPNDSLHVVACVSEYDLPLFQLAAHAANESNTHKRAVKVHFANLGNCTTQIMQIDPRADRKLYHPALSAENGGPLSVQPISDADSTGANEATELVTPVILAKTLPLDSRSARRLRTGQRCKVYLVGERQRLWATLYRQTSKYIENLWKVNTRN